MFDRRYEEKADRKRMRYCLRVLQYNYDRNEPTEVADSLCRIYECLYNRRGRYMTLLFMVLFNLFVGLLVFVIKFFRRKS